ncbi:MAG: hypothetical protein WC045_00065 [Patescibacteria group bacterium]
MNRTFALCAFLAFTLLLSTRHQATALSSSVITVEDHHEKALPPKKTGQVVGLEKTLRWMEKQAGKSQIARKGIQALRKSLKRFTIKAPAFDWRDTGQLSSKVEFVWRIHLSR